MSPSNTRRVRIAVNLVLAVVFVLVITEVLLRIPSLFGRDPAAPGNDPTRTHILAVGDSWTRNHRLNEDENYPRYLQDFLDEASPGTYRVVNLGVPGASSRYVAENLPYQLEYYHPKIVVIWSGLNITPAMANETTGSLLTSASTLLLRNLELYRFIQVWWQDRELEAHAQELSSETAGLSKKSLLSGLSANRAFLDTLDDAQIREYLLRDYRRIASITRAAGAQPIFVTYPLDIGPLFRINESVKQAAVEFDAPVVVSFTSALRVPNEPGKWGFALHPGGAVNREIASDIALLILEEEIKRDPGESETESHPLEEGKTP